MYSYRLKDLDDNIYNWLKAPGTSECVTLKTKPQSPPSRGAFKEGCHLCHPFKTSRPAGFEPDLTFYSILAARHSDIVWIVLLFFVTGADWIFKAISSKRRPNVETSVRPSDGCPTHKMLSWSPMGTWAVVWCFAVSHDSNDHKQVSIPIVKPISILFASPTCPVVLKLRRMFWFLCLAASKSGDLHLGLNTCIRRSFAFAFSRCWQSGSHLLIVILDWKLVWKLCSFDFRLYDFKLSFLTVLGVVKILHLMDCFGSRLSRPGHASEWLLLVLVKYMKSVLQSRRFSK